MASGLLTLLAAGCVTVNLYFPSAEVQKAADQIVDEVHTGGPTKPAPADHSRLGPRLESFVAWFSPASAMAAEQKVDIEVSTPAIRAIKERMKQRFPGLVSFYESGALGETRMGLCAIRESVPLSLARKAELRRIVDGENADRKQLYTEIARANNWPDEQIESIQKLFANSWRAKARTGWWIQDDSGKWMKK
ncbi:MAG: hypothetical protein A2Y95_04315 [Deltaproteobacteria bacterium RBG_13_65_10]|nr:MAG: hypothetical protein A2Y95_04315 [Deltaproteobacteria bacterium RBG_13_65_10]